MPWSEPAVLAACALAAVLLSLIGTLWAKRYGQWRGLLDLPGARRSHRQPTLRGGGIGIVLAGLAACAWLGIGRHPSWWLVAAGLIVVAGVGWIDDHGGLQPWIRLLAHVLAGILLASALWVRGAPGASVVVALLAVPVLVNAWNFMDGIDGLATSQALLCAIGLALLLAGEWRLFAVVVAGACLGFLPFNLPVAGIFLGDVGSGALGYGMAVLAAAGTLSLPIEAWCVLLLAPSAFLVDSGLTLLRRIIRRERWWQAHVQHLYQRLSRRHGHGPVATAYAGWTAAAVGVMLVLGQFPGGVAIAGTMILMLTAAAIWAGLHRSERVATEGFGNE